MDNPDLKNAFYHQPKILKGLLNVGRANGVIPAMSLIDKYIDNISDKRGGKKPPKEFIKNEQYAVKLLSKSVTFENPDDSKNEWVWSRGDIRKLRMGTNKLKGVKDFEKEAEFELLNVKKYEDLDKHYTAVLRVIFGKDVIEKASKKIIIKIV